MCACITGAQPALKRCFTGIIGLAGLLLKRFFLSLACKNLVSINEDSTKSQRTAARLCLPFRFVAKADTDKRRTRTERKPWMSCLVAIKIGKPNERRLQKAATRFHGNHVETYLSNLCGYKAEDNLALELWLCVGGLLTVGKDYSFSSTCHDGRTDAASSSANPAPHLMSGFTTVTVDAEMQDPIRYGSTGAPPLYCIRVLLSLQRVAVGDPTCHAALMPHT